MNITAQMVSDLRQVSDMPLMDCKRALEVCGGNFDQAVAYLRLPTHIRADMDLDARIRRIVREELRKDTQ
jgi:translation elongation factor EF-Ts